MVHWRYRMWVDQTGYDKPFCEFIDEATEVVTNLMRLVPSGTGSLMTMLTSEGKGHAPEGRPAPP